MFKTVLTVDIGSQYIKLVELYKRGSKIIGKKFVRLDTPYLSFEDGFIRNQALLEDRIRTAIDEHHIKSKRVIFTISSSRVITREVTLPGVQDSKINALIKMNLTEYFPIRIEDYTFSHILLERIKEKEKNQVRVLVIATPNEIVNSYNELGSKLNLEIEAIDYLGNSIYQISKRHQITGTNLFLHIGSESTIVTILDNDMLHLQRVIAIGMKQLIRAIGEELNLSLSEALERSLKEPFISLEEDDASHRSEIQEALTQLRFGVKRIVDYYQSRSGVQPIEAIYLTGGGGYTHNIAAIFEQYFSLKTEMVSIGLWDLAKHTNCDEPLFYYGTVGAVYSPLKLMSETTIRASEKKKEQKRYAQLIGIGLILGGALIISPYLRTYTLKKEMNQLNNQIQAVQEIEALVSSLEEAKTELISKEAYITETASTTQYLDELLTAMETYLPTDLYITSFVNSNEGMTLNVIAKDKVVAAKFIQQIRYIEVFSEVNITGLSDYNTASEDGSVSFSAVLIYKELGE